MSLKHLMLSLIASVAALLSWHHLEGIGLGDPTHRGLSTTHAPGEDSLYR